MSRKYLAYLVVALATIVAGCAFIPGMTPVEKQVGNIPAQLIPTPTTETSASLQVSGQAAAVSDPFDLDSVHWMEYQQSTNGGPASDVRLEYSSNPVSGGKMVSIKKTQTSNNAASLNTNSGGKLYSFSSSNTQSSSTSNILSFDQIKADDPILYADDLTGTPLGTESITVPKGTYDCDIFKTSFRGGDAEYWEASGVPIPVKIYTANDESTLELVDWG